MIVGIGTDLAEVARFEQLLARHGQRVARRMLAAAELDEFARAADPARFLAKRFAAKELSPRPQVPESVHLCCCPPLR